MKRKTFLNPPKEGATLAELMDYLKPMNKGELASTLNNSFSSSSAEPEVEDWGILTSLNMTPLEFAEMAVNYPDMWSGDELHYLDSILDGTEPDNTIVDLAERFFLTSPTQEPEVKQTEDDEDEYENWFGSTITPNLALADLSWEPLPVVSTDSDDWWKK